MKEQIHKIENDQYGNEIKRITRNKDFIEITLRNYNDKNDLISEIKMNENNELIQENYYEYNYDALGNKVKINQIHKNTGKIDFTAELSFSNEYDDCNRLCKSICYDHNGNAIYLQTYIYESGLRSKKLEYKEPFTMLYRSSCYQYNKDNQLVCKQVYNNCGDLSYYIKYIMLEDGRYNKSLISPSKRSYRWILDTIETDRCYIEIKELTLTTDMLRDICDYILHKFLYIRNIIIFISESEDITYYKELKELIKDYKENSNLHIIFDI